MHCTGIVLDVVDAQPHAVHSSCNVLSPCGCSLLTCSCCILPAGFGVEGTALCGFLPEHVLVYWRFGLAFALTPMLGFICREISLDDCDLGVELAVFACGDDTLAAGTVLDAATLLIDGTFDKFFPGIMVPQPAPPPPPVRVVNGENSMGGAAARHLKTATRLGGADRPVFKRVVPCVCEQNQRALSGEVSEFPHFVEFSACVIASEAANASVPCPRAPADTTAPALPLPSLAPDLALCRLASTQAPPEVVHNDVLLRVLDAQAGSNSAKNASCLGWLHGSVVSVHTFGHQQEFRRRCSTLANLEHRNILPFLGAWQQPPWLVLGTAPVGTLREVISGAEWQGVVVPWRWAYHVLEDMATALDYLHQRRMYQTHLSPVSVLVWSLFSEAAITVKLSCNDLACFAGASTAFGAKEATRPVLSPLIAPEVGGSRHGTYTPASDVFGFGMVGYELFAQQCPFLDLEDYPSDVARSIADGQRPPLDPGTFRVCVRELLADCWIPDPRMRPSAANILDRLGRPEFLYLRHAMLMPKSSGIECVIAPRGTGECWVCCGSDRAGQVVTVDVGSAATAPRIVRGFWVGQSRILCLMNVHDRIWIGTQAGEVLEYATSDMHACLNHMTVADSVLSMTFHDGRAYLALANGRLMVFQVPEPVTSEEIASSATASPVRAMRDPAASLLEDSQVANHDLTMGDIGEMDDFGRLACSITLSNSPRSPTLACLELVGGTQLWCGSTNSISVLNTATVSKGSGAEWSSWAVHVDDAVPEGARRQHSYPALVTQLVGCSQGVWSSVRRDSILCLWDTVTLGSCLRTLDCCRVVTGSPQSSEARVC